jgi:oligosaccharide repeat unit polymerase
MDLTVYPNTDAFESAALDSETICFPALGITTTVSATLVAVSFVPDYPEPKGALFFPALVMVAGIALAPLVAAVRNPKSLLRTEHVVVLAPVYWLLLDLLQGTYSLDGVQQEHVETAFIGIGVFVVAVWVGAMGRAWKVPGSIISSVSHDLSPNTFFRLAMAAFALGMLPFAMPANFDLMAMIYYLGENRWAAPWARGQLGGWDAFLDQLQYFGYLLPTLTVVVADRAGWLKARTLFCSAMSVIMVIFLMQGGSRRIIGVMFGMAFVTWILTQQRIRTRHVLMGAVAAAMLLFSLELMLDYRTRGFVSLTEGEESKSILERKNVRVDDNFYRLCQVIDLIPTSYPYVYHKYMVWVLVRPIPRVFWPGKPVDPGFDLPSAVGVRGASLTSSVIGELYMAGGFVAIALGGWIYGRLSGMASKVLNQNATLSALIIYTTLTLSLFAGMRSMLELVLMNYVTIAWLCTVKVYQMTVTRSSS